MKRVLVFGASGRTGRHICAFLSAGGYRVIGAVRHERQADALDVDDYVVVDACEREAVAQAFVASKPDAVVWAAGGREDSRVDQQGLIFVADACMHAAVTRLVAITSLGCGDSRPYASTRLLDAIGGVLAAKTVAEDHLVGSSLAWTIVRPGGLVDEPATGCGLLFDDPRVHGRIRCCDLAVLVVEIVDDAASHHKFLSAVDVTTLTGPVDPCLFVPRRDHGYGNSAVVALKGVANA